MSKNLKILEPESFVLASLQHNLQPLEEVIRKSDLELIGYDFEIATRIDYSMDDGQVNLVGNYSGWERRFTLIPPNVPEGSIRNLREVYAPKIKIKAVAK